MTFKLHKRLKILAHFVQQYLPGWCICIWTRSDLFVPISLLHTLHENHFPSIFRIICSQRSTLAVNSFPQKTHSNGFCFKCISLCRSKLVLHLKFLPHSAHLYGRSPMWVVMCSFLATFVANSFSQRLQICHFSWLCAIRCLQGSHTVLNALSQNTHTIVLHWRCTALTWLHLLVEL